MTWLTLEGKTALPANGFLDFNRSRSAGTAASRPRTLRGVPASKIQFLGQYPWFETQFHLKNVRVRGGVVQPYFALAGPDWPNLCTVSRLWSCHWTWVFVIILWSSYIRVNNKSQVDWINFGHLRLLRAKDEHVFWVRLASARAQVPSNWLDVLTASQ
jgi:hypothetical protein